MAPEPAHVSMQALEQLAEGTLPAGEAARARSHVQRCGRCTLEMAAFTKLFAVMNGLQRFTPSPEFADAVMARVRIAPEASPAFAWLRRLLPRTRRGWVLLLAAATLPALPILALVAWVISQPLLSPATVWQWALIRTQSAAQTGFAWLLDQALDSQLVALAEHTYDAIQTVPIQALSAAVLLLAVAIPLSGWAIVRLTRSPVVTAKHAN